MNLRSLFFSLRLSSSNHTKSYATMAEQVTSAPTAEAAARSTRRWLWPSVLRWIPTSTDHIIASEKRLLSIVNASEWKVPTTFIYGYQDWMSYEGAQEARKSMKVPCEIIRVPQSGHFVFIDEPKGFHSAVLYGCRKFLFPDNHDYSLAEGVTLA